MNKKLYQDLRKCFKSDRHLKRAFRLLGNRALYLGGLARVILHEEIEAGINAGKTDIAIARQLGITAKTVYRHRLELWNLKRK